MGGRMEGRKNGGANGWANFHMHGGAMGGACSPYKPNYTKKNGFFPMMSLINTESLAPLHAPHHGVIYKILKYDM